MNPQTMIDETTQTTTGATVQSPRWLTLMEAAMYSRLSRRTLERLCQAGDLPLVKLQGGRTARSLIDRIDLDAFLESRKRTNKAAT